MAGLFNILKVTVGEDKICAHVLVNPGMPLKTSEDIEATARVYYLVPPIAKHLCLGDAGREFQDCMGDTELCHLLEHVTVELMNETGLAGKIACGRTRVSEHDERVFEIEVSCPDDALTIGALSSATFMMDWAFLHADQPAPDVEGTVKGLRHLVLAMRAERGEVEEGFEAPTAADTPEGDAEAAESADGSDVDFAAEPVDADAAEPAVAPLPEPAPAASTYEPEPRMVIDTEGATAEAHEAPAAVYGGAATMPHEADLPLQDGAFDEPAPAAAPASQVAAEDDPGATAMMPRLPLE